MKLSYLATGLSALVFSSQVFAASTLRCTVEKYLQKTGEFTDCGEFTFTLPKDNSYAYGRNECDGLEMYISWIKSGTQDYHDLTIFADKNDAENGFVLSRFSHAFPDSFEVQAHAPGGLDYNVSCSVNN
jgi:hypothetical protein